MTRKRASIRKRSKRSRRIARRRSKKSRNRSQHTVRGGFDPLDCGLVARASQYRDLSFGEKVKLKFCKDKHPDQVDRMLSFGSPDTSSVAQKTATRTTSGNSYPTKSTTMRTYSQ